METCYSYCTDVHETLSSNCLRLLLLCIMSTILTILNSYMETVGMDTHTNFNMVHIPFFESVTSHPVVFVLTSGFFTSKPHCFLNSVTFLILHSVATSLIRRPIKLQTKKQSKPVPSHVFPVYMLSAPSPQNDCEALRRWRQQQILTGDTHSIKGTLKHPDVLWRASCCLAGRSDAPPHTTF